MKLRTDLLPLLTLTWLTDNTLVAGGHNCVPITFSVSSAGTLSFGARLEEDKKQEGGGAAASAMKMFQRADRLGQSELESKLNTTHQNQISEMRIHSGAKGNVKTISTVAGDGKLVIWDIGSLAAKMKNLVI